MNLRRFPLIALVGLVVAITLWASPRGSDATTFTPIQPGGVVFSALGFGANPDITISFNMVAPSANFSTQAGHLVTFGDDDVAIAGDAAVPTGAYIGSLTGAWDLGLVNGPCGAVAVGFDLVEAATPSTAPPVIAPAGPPTNLLANLAEDDGDLDNDGFVEFPGLDNNIADGADAYPTFVAASLDPDGAGAAPPIDPLARYFGVDFVAGALISIVQIVVMPPGSLAPMPNFGWMTPAWGYPVLTFVDNPLGPPSVSPISDFCNLTSSSGLLGIAADNACTAAVPPPACAAVCGPFVCQFAVSAGCPGAPGGECAPPACPCERATNPPAATVLTWRQYVVSQRDWDTAAVPPAAGDGHPNNLDPCLGAVDPAAPVDADGDGVWAACDPFPAVADADMDPPPAGPDGWINRLDNCPLLANVAQGDGDIPVGFAVPDGGPRMDGIGTACDPDPFAINGHYHATALAYHICIGPPAPACAAAADADGDGVVNASDNCIFAANPPITFPDAAPPGGAEPGSDILTAAEAAGSAVLDVGSTAGFTVGSPIVVGAPLETLRYIVAIDPAPAPITLTISAPLAFAHAAGAPVAQVMFSQSQRDLDASGAVGVVGDLAAVAAAFGTIGGTPGAFPGYQGRLDLNYTNAIDIFDLTLEAGVAFLVC